MSDLGSNEGLELRMELIKSKKISVIGMGRLGTPFIACWAGVGFKVIGVDLDENKINMLKNGRSPINEPFLQDWMDRHRNNLSFTTNTQDAVGMTDVTFILVNTPRDEKGSFSLKAPLAVCKDIGNALARKPSYHLIVLASTVAAGSIRKHLIPQLEAHSGKTCGKDFGVCYCPEFVAQGDCINGFLHPDMGLIGASDDKAGLLMEKYYKAFFVGDPPIFRTTLANAEIAKVALNAYVATKITFANIIADVCEKVPEADASEVTRIIGTDSRIGRKFFKGAVSYGGPCFPRDVTGLKEMCEKHGLCKPFLPVAVHETNQNRLETLEDLIVEVASESKDEAVVGILGLSFKPNVDVTDDSPSIWLAEKFIDYDWIKLIGYDPMAKHEIMEQAKSANECISKSDVIVVMVAWEEFKKIPADVWKNKIIIDCWGIIENVPDTARYIKLGKYIEC